MNEIGSGGAVNRVGSGGANGVLHESGGNGASAAVIDNRTATDATSGIIATEGSPGGSGTPPETWKEHWFEHTKDLKLVEQTEWVAMYFDDAVDREGTDWMLPFMTDVWRYTVTHYGKFTDGQRDGKLYAVFHQGSYSGGHPSTYLQSEHDYRNVSDVAPGPWNRPDYDVASHEVAHIVEDAAQGFLYSPTFKLWDDSKWAEIFQYDLYLGIGKTAEAKVLFDRFSAIEESYPRAGTFWFRDWFYPVWRDHGRAELMPRYFKLVAANFPKSGLGYARDLNFGEFVHFMSGAAKANLQDQATLAFGWPAERDAEFKAARSEFPNVKY